MRLAQTSFEDLAMVATPTLADAQQNQLLAKLPAADLIAILPLMQFVLLKTPDVVSEANEPIEHAYFPIMGMLSIVSIMRNGDIIEVASVGKDGAFGTCVFQEQLSLPYRCFVQSPGAALRLTIETLEQIVSAKLELHRLIMRYNGSLAVLSMQSAACNGLHNVEARCCRWLLTTRDRLQSDTLNLTHEFLGQMLGVRRASVSDILKPLREQGLLQYVRGQITLTNMDELELRACECYRVTQKQFSWLQPVQINGSPSCRMPASVPISEESGIGSAAKTAS
jgi:CRP-like cAMP-binding protein